MNRKMILVTAALLVCAGLISAAQQGSENSGQNKSVPAPRKGTTPADDDKVSGVPATTNSNYLIGPEDVLDITVWKEPDVSRVVPVRPDGRISLPLINDVQAAGLSPEQLATALAEKMGKFLNKPQVTVIVTAINSQRVFVVGEVLRAGAFPLLPGMTVLQALASAGGFTTFADVKKIHVMRMRDGKQAQLAFSYREVLRGEKPEQNVTLEPGDTIVVP
jgi:polysaccharide export outer membrane protein